MTYPCEACGVSLDVCMDLDLHCCVVCRAKGCHNDPAPTGDLPQESSRG